MNTNLSKRSLHVPQMMCDTFEERAVDLDMVLPDYVPEISAVLKCTMRPFITARNQSGDRYTVDGTVSIRVLYVTEDRKTVYCYEASQPFHVSFACEKAIHNFVTLKTDYVNCRALSSRRLDIHGAFRVFLKAIGEGEISVFAPTVQRDVFFRTKTLHSMNPVFETEKYAVLEERMDIGNTVDRYVFADATVVSTDVKALVNKVIVKGTVRIRAVCAHDEQYHELLQEFPFSQIVDAEGACDRWRCGVDVQIGECDVHMQTSEGTVPFLMMHAKLGICVRGYVPMEETVVLDAYSVHAPLLCESSPIRYMQDRDVKAEHQTITAQTDLPDSVADIVQLWGEQKSCECVDGVRNMCLALSMIAKDEQGAVSYYERTVDVDCSQISEDLTSALRLVSVEGTVIGHALRLQLDVASEYETFATQTETVVCDAVEEDRNPYVKSNAAIRIVYAGAGDSVWEIAKAHHACVQDILDENDLSDTVITVPTMLMIPMM